MTDATDDGAHLSRRGGKAAGKKAGGKAGKAAPGNRAAAMAALPALAAL